jgi:DNA-binding response OmpR family regulator
VLVVEDNRNISEMIGEYLEGRGFEVDYAQDGLDGYRLAAENSYDVVVLDSMLPRLDGIEVCRRLRNDARKSTPVLMLTARDTLDDKLTGLGFGADDYLTKPFAIQELEARLRALIRRERRQVGSEVLKVADLVLDPVSMRATRAGTELQLSPIGLRLLTILMRESPRVVTRQEIEREIWGNGLPDSDTCAATCTTCARSSTSRSTVRCCTPCRVPATALPTSPSRWPEQALAGAAAGPAGCGHVRGQGMTGRRCRRSSPVHPHGVARCL